MALLDNLIKIFESTSRPQVNVDVYRQLQGVRPEPIAGSDSFLWVSKTRLTDQARQHIMTSEIE